MRIIMSLMLLILFSLDTTTITLAADAKLNTESDPQTKNISKEKTKVIPKPTSKPIPQEKLAVNTQQILTIESKVTGSQEQPKVLYIMPWQGITNPITIKDKEMQLTMPSFQPVNPKTFKKEVRDFNVNQAQVQAQAQAAQVETQNNN